jgi:hypothetical protein
VRRNLILSVPGSAEGTAGTVTQGYGLFLDDNTADVAAEGNFIAAADIGIRIRGRGHVLAGNVLYGNRSAPLRDESGGMAGDGRTGNGKGPDRFRDNVLCSSSCDGGATARYPGVPPSLLAERFRDFAARLGTGDPDPKAQQAALKGVLPASPSP